MKIAVIADVHGNRWALAAVLAELDRRSVDRTVDLGDCVYGPLDPAGTAEILVELGADTVRGNQDRVIDAPDTATAASPTYRRVLAELEPAHRRWLAALPPTRVVDGLFLCHGTPSADDVYLLEQVAPDGAVALAPPAALTAALAGVEQGVVLCGHSHLPRAVAAGGRLIVNPGSVGLPAYTHDAPAVHAMEAGSPHARCAVLEHTGDGWRVEHLAVPYDWESAAATAARHGREDWAYALRTGRAPR